MIAVILFIAFAFIGYLIGRIGDYFGGHVDFFHHWIYGAILIVVGIFIHYIIIAAGIGLVISDAKDLMHLRVYGPDKKTIKRFWGID